MNGGQHVPFDAGQYSFFGDPGDEGGGLEGDLEDTLEVHDLPPDTSSMLPSHVSAMMGTPGPA